jgi:2-oxoglutarate dehydrogenase E2 component (dihydrolipoamide succinyltransferase)
VAIFFLTHHPHYYVFLYSNKNHQKEQHQMIVEIHIPEIGESISFVQIARWLVQNGEVVEKDQEIAEIDSDKATLSLTTDHAGAINILVAEGVKTAVGDLVCTIDTDKSTSQVKEQPKIVTDAVKENKPAEVKASETVPSADHKILITPVAQNMIREHQLDVNEIMQEKMSRITKSDVAVFLGKKQSGTPVFTNKFSREIIRKELTPLRKKLSERLVQFHNQTAMLTTYNEVDMTEILRIRKEYGERFMAKHGQKLGMMSFFAKACTLALRDYPGINSSLDANEVLYHEYVDMGIAVSTDKGLMVPVVKNAESLNLAQLELQINTLAEKARNKKITLDELTGGTFTITNGGVFGSLLSTPIINPPQVAILGMHKIQERPVGIDGKIVLKPMMYVALTYDHRIVDGRESVGYLVKVKELLENPALMFSETENSFDLLFNL